jgi:tRNA G18 (ribose-2'-O)-methylase SpoU
MRGYFGIGIEMGKNPFNLGSLWRSAENMGASFIFTIGGRYKPQKSDTGLAYRSIPLHEYKDFTSFMEGFPKKATLIAVDYIEGKSRPINNFVHPERAVYVLGGEDVGLSQECIQRSSYIVHINSKRCINVSCAGSILIYDRTVKNG